MGFYFILFISTGNRIYKLQDYIKFNAFQWVYINFILFISTGNRIYKLQDYINSFQCVFLF